MMGTKLFTPNGLYNEEMPLFSHGVIIYIAVEHIYTPST
jgi:hypothetical protein